MELGEWTYHNPPDQDKLLEIGDALLYKKDLAEVYRLVRELVESERKKAWFACLDNIKQKSLSSTINQ